MKKTLNKMRIGLVRLFMKTTRRLLKKFRLLSRKRQIIVILIILVVVVATVIGLRTAFHKEPPIQSGPIAQVETGLQKGSPEYTTVLPEGKSIETLGGWTRVSPPDRNPVYAYVDMIGRVRVIVSQQELPASFASDPDEKTKQLATGYNATKTLTVGSTEAYTGVSTQGIESVILRIKSTLILIKSDTPIDDNDLKDYINSLD